MPPKKTEIIIKKIEGLEILLIPAILGFFHFVMLIFNSTKDDVPLWYLIFWITLFYIATTFIFIGIFKLKFEIKRYEVKCHQKKTN